MKCPNMSHPFYKAIKEDFDKKNKEIEDYNREVKQEYQDLKTAGITDTPKPDYKDLIDTNAVISKAAALVETHAFQKWKGDKGEFELPTYEKGLIYNNYGDVLNFSLLATGVELENITESSVSKLVDNLEGFNEKRNSLLTRINKIKNQIKIVEKSSGDAPKELVELVEKSEEALDSASIDEAIYSYILLAETYTASAMEKLMEINERYKREDLTDNERRQLFTKMFHIYKSNVLFQDTGQLFELMDEKEGFGKGDMENTAEEAIMNTAKFSNKMSTIYKSLAIKHISSFLNSYNLNPNLNKKDIKQLLVSTTEDISYATYMSNSLGTAPDQVLQIVNNIMQSKKERVNQKVVTTLINGELGDAYNALRKSTRVRKHEKLYDFMLARDSDGKLTGAIKKPNELDDDLKKEVEELTKVYESNEESLKKGITIDEILEDGKFSGQARFYVAYKVNKGLAEYHLPNQYKRGFQLIPIYKNSTDRIYDESGAKKLGAIKESALDNFTFRKDNEKDFVFVNADGTEHKFIPIKYTSTIGNKKHNISPNDVSLDLFQSLISFSQMSENYSEMLNVYSEMETLKDIMSTREYNGKTDQSGNPIQMQGIESKAYKRLVKAIDMMMYGERKKVGKTITLKKGVVWNKEDNLSELPDTIKKDLDKKVISYDSDGNMIYSSSGLYVYKKEPLLTSLPKIGDGVAKFTSIIGLGFNMFSGVNNLLMGTLMNRMEASGGRFYNKKDLRKAYKQYAGKMKTLFKDKFTRVPKSNFTKWMMEHDIIQQFNEFGTAMSEDRVSKSLTSTDTLYFLSSMGENKIQVTMAMAMMNSHKVLENGKIVSADEWADIQGIDPFSKEGKARIKEEFNSLPSVYEKVEAGEKVDPYQMTLFTRRVKELYRQNHGNYSYQDLTVIQQYSLGRLGMLFRKWVKPGWDKRWAKLTYNGEDRYNQNLRSEEGGMYIATLEFLKGVKKDGEILKMFFGRTKTKAWQELPTWKKRKVMQTVAELKYATFAILAGMLIAGLAEGVGDDEDKKFLQFLEYQVRRLNSEFSAFTNPMEALKILKTPSAAITVLDDTMDLLDRTINPFHTPGYIFETYERGRYAGQLKLWKETGDLIPVLNQVDRLFKVDETLSYIKR